MAKWPYEQYYPLEFERDTAGLSMCAKGVWISILNNMWPEDIPTISGSLSFWCRLLRCMPEEFELAVLELSQNHGNNPVADIIYQDEKTGKFITALPKCKDVQGFGNNLVSITCRRIKRRVELKENNKIYMQRYRQEKDCNETINKNVEFSKRVESELESESKNKQKKNKQKESLVDFDKFYTAYPKKLNKGDAQKAWKKIQPPPDNFQLDIILNKIELGKQSENWKDKQYIPYPATWLNRHGWLDEYTPLKDKDNGSGKQHEAARIGANNEFTDQQLTDMKTRNDASYKEFMNDNI